MTRSPALWFFIFLALAVLLAAFAPLEKTLGPNARLVYFHGAWVWVAMLLFLAAALLGAIGLLARRKAAHRWSQALGRAGLCLWVAFLFMSLYVMQVNWNGIYWDEPRFRIPLNLAVVGLLLQIGLSLLPEIAWTSLGNLVYALVFFVSMRGIQAVLHPDSPILRSDARDIQLYFIALLVLISAAAWQLARWWYFWQGKRMRS